MAADSGASSSVTTSQNSSANSTAPTDIFNLLLSQNNVLPLQENFTALGKNLPAKATDSTTDKTKSSEKLVDNSIDALQSALASLAIQQSVPAPVQRDTISGQQGEDTVIGGAQSLAQNATATQPLTSDSQNVSLQTQDLLDKAAASQQPAQSILQKANALYSTAQNKAIAAQNQANAIQNKAIAAQYQLNANQNQVIKAQSQATTTQNKVIAAQYQLTANQNQTSAAQNQADQILQNKTFNAYRAGAALTQPEVGSTLDTNDVDAAKKIAAAAAAITEPKIVNTPEAIAVVAPSPQATTQASNTATNNATLSVPTSKDNSAQEAANSTDQLTNDASVTPLSQADQKSKADAALGDNKSLTQVAKIQPAPVPTKPEADKVSAKSDSNSGQNDQNNAANTVTPQAVSAASQQQNLSQQFGQKKQNADDNIDAVKPAGAKSEANNLQPVQAPVQKPEVVNNNQQDFASSLNKAIVSPADQVAMKIAQLPSGKHNITVQLDPADLGKVDVRLEWSTDGKAQISIAAEHKTTLDMLKSNAGSLQASLSDSGIKADAGSLQFSLRGQDNFAGQFAQGNQQQSNGNNSNSTTQTASGADLKQTIETASIAARYVNLNNLVDLHV